MLRGAKTSPRWVGCLDFSMFSFPPVRKLIKPILKVVLEVLLVVLEVLFWSRCLQMTRVCSPEHLQTPDHLGELPRSILQLLGWCLWAVAMNLGDFRGGVGVKSGYREIFKIPPVNRFLAL